MYVLEVGAGKVGWNLARELIDKGNDRSWEDQGGAFTVGTALEIDALLEAGIDRADAFVASTDGDNTNLVIAQIAQKRFRVENVVVRVLDPAHTDDASDRRWICVLGLADPTRIGFGLRP